MTNVKQVEINVEEVESEELIKYKMSQVQAF